MKRAAPPCVCVAAAGLAGCSGAPETSRPSRGQEAAIHDEAGDGQFDVTLPGTRVSLAGASG